MMGVSHESSVATLLQFWGKARPSPSSRNAFHPLVYHSLDVAAVGQVMLESRADLTALFADRLGMAGGDAAAFVTFLLALHDVGKISTSFQQQAPELWPGGALGTLRPAPRLRHEAIGRHRLIELSAGDGLSLFADLKRSVRCLLLDAVTGHHGRPPDEIGPLLAIDQACTPFVRSFCDVMGDLFRPIQVSGLRKSDASALSWRLAGFTVLCDWIGSNQAWFPYEPPDHDPQAYLETVARPRAAGALDAAGVRGARVSRATSFAALTNSRQRPSPIQAWAERADLPQGPALVLIEDMTGSGKTEAALILAKRLMDRGSARGVFVALPTMATANGMYARLAASYRRMFDDGETPSLVLAHSARGLHREFARSIAPYKTDVLGFDSVSGGDAPSIGEAASESEDAADRVGDDAGAACSAWVADDRRRTFLAEVGIGTIDQAFLAVLPTKYQSLRLFGLADRVLVVDEAHAFDPYMGEELLTLLRFQAAQGGSAIILSATLPAGKREAIMAAFAKGLGGAPANASNDAYPLTTVVGRCGGSEQAHATRPDLPRTLSVKRIGSDADACTYIETARRRGAAVAWVRNTVDDVLDAAAMLEAKGHDVTVFHARMAMGDRLTVEAEIVARFGRTGPPEGRPGILVATQVIEQSLDLDFDAMVSDLAPVDLLLQRAGRLWRHAGRSRAVPGPELAVVSPEPVQDAGRRWYEAAFPRAGWVYEDHALLWLSAHALFGRPAWRIPEDVRDLIQAVDSGLETRSFPPAFERKANEAEGAAGAEQAAAKANLLKIETGYCAENGPWESDVRTPTRLGEDRVTLRLARVEDDRLVPWSADDDPHRAWALSEVSVRPTQATGEVIPDSHRDAAQAVRGTWPRFDQHKLLVPLTADEEGVWRGEIQDSQSGARNISYSAERGLLWSRRVD